MVNGQSSDLTLNVIPKNLYDIYAEGYADSEGVDQVGLEDVSTQLSILELFPSADQPLATLVAKYIEPDATNLDSLLLSSFSWMETRHEGEPLVDIIAELKQIFTGTTNTVLKETLAYYLSQAVSEADNGYNSKFRSIRTALVVWAEMARDNPQAAQAIEQSVNNAKDLWTWMRFISLPANGWGGPNIPTPAPGRTCDQITEIYNQGTPYEYSPVSCRASGQAVGDTILNIADFVTENYGEQELLSDTIRLTINSLRGAEYEYTKDLFKQPDLQASTLGLGGIVPDAHAWVQLIPTAIRAVLLSSKIAGKAIAKEGAVNLANFVRGGTNSRVSPSVLIGAMVYLQSRFPEVCTSPCIPLNDQVAENVNKNIVLWFTALSLSKKGVVVGNEVQKTACMFQRHGHGAAFEIVATAFYHAMREFKGRQDFEILAADPSKDDVLREVPIYQKENLLGKHAELYDRKMDLVLKGGADGDPPGHYWIELKSWAEIKKKDTWTLTGEVSSKLPENRLWDGKSTTKTDAMLHNAHRQHVIDHIAAGTTETIKGLWEDEVPEPKQGWKPGKHRTWIQVWKQPDKPREYWNYDWKNKKWEKPKNANGGNANGINPAKSFIEADGIITDADLTSKFKGLQKYFTSLPTGFGARQFEENFGYSTEKAYEVGYQNLQVGRVKSVVAPFTILNATNIELGSSQDMIKEMYDAAGLGEWKEFLESPEISAEQLDVLKAKAREEFEKQFETLSKINNKLTEFEDKYFPEEYLELRDQLEDSLEGMAGDEIRDQIADVELPQYLSPDGICELQ